MYPCPKTSLRLDLELKTLSHTCCKLVHKMRDQLLGVLLPNCKHAVQSIRQLRAVTPASAVLVGVQQALQVRAISIYF